MIFQSSYSFERYEGFIIINQDCLINSIDYPSYWLFLI